MTSILRAARAGFAYFAMALAAGFGLGIVRVQALAPRLGETPAVLVELPVILAISWLACRWTVARFAVPPSYTARWIMGLTAFVLLIIAELSLGVLAFGRTLAEQLERYGQLPELLGLAGQLLFAAFPAIQMSMRRRR